MKHLFNIVPIVNNAVIYSLKYIKNVDLILSVFFPQNRRKPPKTNPTKGHKEIFTGDGYVQYLGCGDDILGLCICPKSSRCIHEMCAIFFVYQLYLSKVFCFVFLRSVY